MVEEITQGARVIERMMKALTLRKESELAALLGVKPPALSNAKRQADVPDVWYLRLSQMHGLDPAYLRTGVGEPRSRPEEASAFGQAHQRLFQIPLVSCEFSKKGGFKPLAASHNPMWFSRERAQAFAPSIETLILVEFKGNHMIPEYYDGDFVIVDQNRTHPEPFTSALVRIEDSMTVFNVMLAPGEVLFLSNDTRVPPLRVPRERLGSPQAEILGTVVGMARMGGKR
jgi:hypothetical protein